jgi:hypothetical protein
MRLERLERIAPDIYRATNIAMKRLGTAGLVSGAQVPREANSSLKRSTLSGTG